MNRHISRWEAHAVTPDALGRQSAALLLTLKGSACIYQGEELGLPEAELEYSELTDPPGLRFWPENKGRDGCRTPMPWTDTANAGFSEAKPWLPVKGPHLKRNVAALEADPDSLLHYYRAILKYRKDNHALIDGEIVFHDVKEPILGFSRQSGQDALVCVFNLSAKPHDLSIKGLPNLATLAVVSNGAVLKGKALQLEGNGLAIIECGAGFDPAAISLTLSKG